MSKSFTKFLRYAHRNVGVVASLFLLLLVVTGIALNHTEALSLADSAVPAWVADRYYADQDLRAWRVGDDYFYSVGESLHRNRVALGTCAGFFGALGTPREVVVGCDDELLLYTAAGDLIERIGPAHGLPGGIRALARGDAGELVLVTDTGAVAFDTESLAGVPAAGEPVTSGSVPLPEQMLLAEAVSWQQLLLDLHSGRFLGRGGVWLMDFVAILLGLLAVSGVIMYLTPRDNGNGKSG